MKPNKTINTLLSIVVAALFIRIAQPNTMVPILNQTLLYYIATYVPVMIITVYLFLLTSKDPVLWQHVQIRTIWYMFTWVSFLSVISINRPETVRSTIALLLYLPLIIAIVRAVETQEHLQKIFQIIPWSLLLLSVHAIIIFRPDLYPTGIFFPGLGEYIENPNGITVLFSAAIPFVYLTAQHTKQRTLKQLYYTILLLSVGMVIFAASRAGFIALMLLAGIYWVRSSKKIYGVVAIIIFVGIASITVNSTYKEEITTITDTKYSPTLKRFDMWELSLDTLFPQKPWGWGIKNTQRVLEPITGLTGGNHSFYLTFLTDMGIVGTLLFLRLLWISVKDAHNTLKTSTEFIHDASFACMTSLLIILTIGLVEAINYMPIFWLLVAFIAATSKVNYYDHYFNHNTNV